MKKIIFSTISLFAFLLSYNTNAQENKINEQSVDSVKAKYISIGAKIGVPNVIGGSAEIILPFLGNHFAPFFDYSGFKINTDDIESNLKYIEYGVNFYFSKKGHGFYVGAGQAVLDTDITFKKLEFSEAGITVKGSGAANLELKTTNFKLGIKTGGRFYFRFEVGYGIGDVPSELNFSATSSGITQNFSEEIPAIPGLGTSGVLIGNIGFGISF